MDKSVILKFYFFLTKRRIRSDGSNRSPKGKHTRKGSTPKGVFKYSVYTGRFTPDINKEESPIKSPIKSPKTKKSFRKTMPKIYGLGLDAMSMMR